MSAIRQVSQKCEKLAMRYLENRETDEEKCEILASLAKIWLHTVLPEISQRSYIFKNIVPHP